MTKKERYQNAYEKQRQFYLAHKNAKRALVFLNRALPVCTVLGYLFFVGFYLVWNRERETIDYFRILLYPALCFLLSSVFRYTVNRKRPYEEGIEPIIDKKTKGQSFPSRHTASAFVIGTCALFYCVPLGVGLLLVGTAISYIRFALGLHYPSDLSAGAILGVLFGLLCLI